MQTLIWKQNKHHWQPTLKFVTSIWKTKIFLSFFREFYLSGSYKDCCNMKVICLIEISSCLVKHTEVTQKYISELTELKKSKDYMQPDKTYFCISYHLLRQLSSNCYIKHLQEMQGSFCLESQDTLTHNIYKETFTDTLIEKLPSTNIILRSPSCQMIKVRC